LDTTELRRLTGDADSDVSTAGLSTDAGGHALVVGGTGMLAGLCDALAADGLQVTVVGRDPARLRRVAARSRRIHPLSADYERIPAFAAALAVAACARGPIELAVCWIRSWAPQSLLAVASAVAPGGRLFHVLGSGHSDASAPAIAELERRGDLRYRRIQLGAVVEDGGRRWLTDEEISGGVHAAILADRPNYLVGTAAP
jgi:hypothetical protein